MRTLSFSRLLLGAALVLGAAAACGYDPKPEDGTLKCGPSNTCPQNYTCMSGACWRDGGGGTANVAMLMGHWTSDPNLTTRVRVCTDGTNETMFWDDFLDLLPNSPASALTTNYYCDWKMDVNAGGTATTVRSGQMCTHPAAGDPTTNFTWHGMTLTLMTTDGSHGTLDMSLPYEYTTTSGSGSCTMDFTGPMNKN